MDNTSYNALKEWSDLINKNVDKQDYYTTIGKYTFKNLKPINNNNNNDDILTFTFTYTEINNNNDNTNK